jgi:hypothetical protein
MNNVFEWFVPDPDRQRALWAAVLGSLKVGTILVTYPAVEMSLASIAATKRLSDAAGSPAAQQSIVATAVAAAAHDPPCGLERLEAPGGEAFARAISRWVRADGAMDGGQGSHGHGHGGHSDCSDSDCDHSGADPELEAEDVESFLSVCIYRVTGPIVLA